MSRAPWGARFPGCPDVPVVSNEPGRVCFYRDNRDIYRDTTGTFAGTTGTFSQFAGTSL